MSSIPSIPRENRTLRRSRTAPRRAGLHVRSGLAPLEMILGLPLILLLFALIINAGFTGMWKLRLLGASREVAWRSRDPRTNNLPNPGYQSTFWMQPKQSEDTPLTTGTSAEHPLNIPDLSSAAAVRAHFGSLNVDTQLLDPKRGVFQGTSDITRKLPLLPNGLQPMQSNPKHHLADDSFPFWNTHLASNIGRRTKILYGEWHSNPFFKQADAAFANPPPQSNRGISGIEYGNDWYTYESTVVDTHNALYRDNLLPLGSFNPKNSHPVKYTQGNYHDPEVYTWRYRGILPNPPRFMPHIPEFISSDANAIRQSHVDPHILKIEDDDTRYVDGQKLKEVEGNLPHALAGEYIRFFGEATGLVQQHIDEISAQMSVTQSDVERANLQAQLNAATTELQRRQQILNPVIQQLKTYQTGF